MDKDQKNNILVPVISIIYKNEKDIMDCKNIYLTTKYAYVNNKKIIYESETIDNNNAIFFISGMDSIKEGFDIIKSKDKTFTLFDGKRTLYKENMIQYNKYKKYLENFYSLSSDQLSDSIEFYKKKAKEAIENKDNKNLGLYFNHTEDWLSYYLLRYEDEDFGGLCENLINGLKGDEKIKNIKAIVFNIRSFHDICDVCSPKLSILLEKLKENKKKFIKIVNKKMSTLNTFDENLKIFMITSAEKADSNQASERDHYIRDHYIKDSSQNKKKELSYHGNRRKNFGRDDLTLLSDKPIEILDNLPFDYIQVPVNDKGEIVKIDIN